MIAPGLIYILTIVLGLIFIFIYHQLCHFHCPFMLPMMPMTPMAWQMRVILELIGIQAIQ